MNVRTENFNLEFTADIDERGRVTIPKAIMDVILARKGDKVTLVVRMVHKLVKES